MLKIKFLDQKMSFLSVYSMFENLMFQFAHPSLWLINASYAAAFFAWDKRRKNDAPCVACKNPSHNHIWYSAIPLVSSRHLLWVKISFRAMQRCLSSSVLTELPMKIHDLIVKTWRKFCIYQNIFGSGNPGQYRRYNCNTILPAFLNVWHITCSLYVDIVCDCWTFPACNVP